MIVKLNNLLAIKRDAVDNKLTSNDIRIMFNQFLIEFERIENHQSITTEVFLDAIEEIVDAVLSILPYKLLDPKVLHHPLMYFLHQLLISKLDKWCIRPLRFNIQEMDIFLKTILIFVHIAEQVPVDKTDEDQKRIKDLLITKKFLFQVRDQIDNIVLNRQSFNKQQNIYALGLMIIRLLQQHPYSYKIGKNERLINDLVMNTLYSYDFIQVMYQLQHGKSFTDTEYYLLFICWEYLSATLRNKQYPSTKITSIDLIHYLSDELLTRLQYALNRSKSMSPSSLAYIYKRYYQLLNVLNLPSFDKHASIIIDHLTHILQNSSPINKDEDEMIITALEAFYNLTTNSDIRMIMRKKHLLALFKNYILNDKGQKRKLAFSILAEIMDEQQITKHINGITSYFINELKYLDPNEYNPDVDITLSSLKALMQYEQVKNEFVKQGGLEPLTTFIRDTGPNQQFDKQKVDVLNILWSCSIRNSQALHTLQEDTELINRVNQLHHDAQINENTSLQKAAEGLIWKVEKEEQFKQQLPVQKTSAEEDEEEEEEQYDCMISYSWADMDLAHRIFHHLTEKLGYKIWLDQEQMHGSTIQAMANAVENAQFILMCMSETYKRSANCQSEAEYAFNRKKHIVPIKMKKDFTPDGWLGFILGTRMYIDFGTYDFDKAIGLLQNEIELQKKKRKEAKDLAKVAKKPEEDNEIIDKVEEKRENDDNDEINEKFNWDNVTNWDEAIVQDFLRKQQLSDLLPVCNGLNGEELLSLYKMCKSSSVSMYRSLRSELSVMHEKVLPISTFLHFLSRLRTINGNNQELNRYIHIEYCDEYSQDDE